SLPIPRKRKRALRFSIASPRTIGKMQSIEIAGTLSSPLAESDLAIHVQSDFAVARTSIVPVKHGPVRPFVTRRFGSVTFTDAKGLEQRPPENLGPIGIPGNL